MSDLFKSHLFLYVCIILGIILIAGIILAITISLKSKQRTREIENYGKPSEKRLKQVLEDAFSANAVFTNVYIPYSNGNRDRCTEIDAIVVLRSGVYVIELKSHNGKIISPDSNRWTQIYNDKRISFYNPIYQNESHVKVINRILRSEGQYNVPIYSIVVFSSNKVTFTKQYEQIVGLNGLVKHIKSLGKNDAVSIAQTSRIKTILHSYIRTGRRIEIKHKKFVRKHRH